MDFGHVAVPGAGQKTRLLAYAAIVTAAATLSACGGGSTGSSPNSGVGSSSTRSPSYMDGVAMADQVRGDSTSNPDGHSIAVGSAVINGCNPTTGSCQFASGDGTSDADANGFCIFYAAGSPNAAGMPAGDNRSEWMQGCIDEYKQNVSAFMHPQ